MIATVGLYRLDVDQLLAQLSEVTNTFHDTVSNPRKKKKKKENVVKIKCINKNLNTKVAPKPTNQRYLKIILLPHQCDAKF